MFIPQQFCAVVTSKCIADHIAYIFVNSCTPTSSRSEKIIYTAAEREKKKPGEIIDKLGLIDSCLDEAITLFQTCCQAKRKSSTRSLKKNSDVQ